MRIFVSLFATALAFTAVGQMTAHAADVVVNGVNLGSCTRYTDGCNECNVMADGQSACTKRACIQAGTPKCLDTDTSLLDQEPTAAAPDFKVKTFASCSDMKRKVADFMELYYEAHPPYNYHKGGPMPIDVDMAVPPPTAPGNAGGMPTSESKSPTASDDHSTTNTRTIGVDEPERVKTDGKYLYSANDADHMVYIHKADDSLTLVKKIALPAEYANTQLFVSENRLTIVSSKYVWNNIYKNAWIDRTNKTVVVVYDTTDMSNPTINRYFQVDGGYREARLVNGQLTLMSTTNFNFPYDRYIRPQVDGTDLIIDTDKLVSNFSTINVLPKKIEIMPTGPMGNVNDYLEKSRKARRLRELDASNCANISYVFPDEKTLESYNFNPSFTAITTINVNDNKRKSSTKLFFGDVEKAYLSATNKLYLSSTLYAPYGYTCPPGMMCAMRWIEPGSNTIVHKFALSGNGARYEHTGLVSGTLLTDYAIDESAAGNVRLVTHQTGSKPDNLVTTLSPQLAKVSTLEGIASDENFQSARFIGDKLYLVTFQRIDPLFVIDLADAANPKILGELKIPGYSTYLHPYDDKHLIGIGYDTTTNQWGGTQNAGIKIDLYDISDFSKPKQAATLTLGKGPGSYSEALNNPRLFVWQKSKNLLYLPATLYTSMSGSTDMYRYSDVFQGVVAVSIDPKNGVVEKARTTHLDMLDNATLEAARTKECATYTAPKAPVCKKLIGGGEYCEWVSSYVPNYCYADSPIGEYRAAKIWNYSNYFIDRSLYAGNRLFTFSPAQIESLDIDAGLAQKGSAKLNGGTATPKPLY